MKIASTFTIAALMVLAVSDSFAAAPGVGKNKPQSHVLNANEKPTAESDAWRFKFYQGHWWYWLPANHWAVYENRHWLVSPEEQLASEHLEANKTMTETPTPAAPLSGEASFADDYPASPDSPEAARHSAEYHLAVGNTYSKHADQHAKILEKYSALSETVPAGIVKDHAGAIRHDVEHAQKAFSRLAKADKGNPRMAESVEKIQQGLQKVTESVRNLEAQAKQQGTFEAQLIRGQTAEISALLNDSYSAAREADRKFYDLHSDDYYTSGEGHFVD